MCSENSKLQKNYAVIVATNCLVLILLFIEKFTNGKPVCKICESESVRSPNPCGTCTEFKALYMVLSLKLGESFPQLVRMPQF